MKNNNIKINCNSSTLKNGIMGGFSAFSIIEIMVWIFIFSLWIASVFAIISSTIQITDYNKNYIIATNLASEQIELIRNIRDSNYKKIQKYNQINPWSSDYNNLFEIGKKYKIENNYSITANFPIAVTDITTWFEEWQTKLKGLSMNSYNLCLDSLNRYTYNCETGSQRTKFYKYIDIEKVKYMENWTEKQIDNAFIVNSKVIWYSKWYHEFEVKSIIADFKRL
jgi:Tfp pilus assembly protein PilV